MHVFRSGLAKSSLALGALVALSLLGACGERPAAPNLPTGLAPRMGAAVPTGKIAVTVTKADGTPAAGFLFVPFQQQLGPFRADGSFAGVPLDDNGQATVDGLARGLYCGTVRGVPRSTYDLGFFAPPENAPHPTLDPSLPFVGAITAATDAVPFTADNFATYCVATPPLTLQGSLKLAIQLPSATAPGSAPGTVRFTIKDLTGHPVTPPAWAVVATPLPWAPSGLAARGIGTALLLSAAPGSADADGFQTAVGLPAGDVLIQTALFPGNTGTLTATLHSHVGAGTTSTATATAEPNVCLVDKSPEATEPLGDVPAGAPLDFVGFGDASKIRLGWGADANLALTPDVVALWYRQRGTGSATLHLRLNGSGVDNLQADYTCPDSGACTVTTKGPRSTVVPAAFAEPDADGTTRVSWIVSGIPAGVTFIDLQLSTSQEQWPNTSRSGVPSGFFRLYEPTGPCNASQGSDDKFWFN